MTTERISIEMTGVREYGEGDPVLLIVPDGRPMIRAFNEAGCCYTEVDLLDLIAWLRANWPEFLEEPKP